jgi:hypothetical protein
MLPRVAGAALGALGFWIILTPAVAQAAAAYANHQWVGGQGMSAAYWFEVARRIEPRDWRYHWYMGRFWYVQALENNNPAAARLADATFAAGANINPLEFRNLLGRIVTHTHLRKLIPEPADPGTLRAWCDRALALAPLDPQVQAEVRFAQAQIDGKKGGDPQ